MASFLSVLAQSRRRGTRGPRGPRGHGESPSTEIRHIKTIQDAAEFVLTHLEYQEKNLESIVATYERRAAATLGTHDRRADLLDFLFIEFEKAAEASIFPLMRSMTIWIPMLVEWYAVLDAPSIQKIHGAEWTSSGKVAQDFTSATNETGLAQIFDMLVTSKLISDKTKKRIDDLKGRWSTPAPSGKSGPRTLKERAESMIEALKTNVATDDTKPDELSTQLYHLRAMKTKLNKHYDKINKLITEFNGILGLVIDATYAHDLRSAESEESAAPAESAKSAKKKAAEPDESAKKKAALAAEIEMNKNELIRNGPAKWLADARKAITIQVYQMEIKVHAEKILQSMTGASKPDIRTLVEIEAQIYEVARQVTEFFDMLIADLEQMRREKEDYTYENQHATKEILDNTLMSTVRPLYVQLAEIIDNLNNADSTSDDIRKRVQIVGKITESFERLHALRQLATNEAQKLYDECVARVRPPASDFGRVASTNSRRLGGSGKVHSGRGKARNWSYGTRFGEYVHRAAQSSVRVAPRAWGA